MSFEQKKAQVPSEAWVAIITAVEDLILRGYLDESRKDAATEKFLDDYIQKQLERKVT